MYRGYRGIIVSASLCLALWSQTPRAKERLSPSPKHQTENSDKKENIYIKPTPVVIFETPDQANTKKRREDESRKHDARALQAQIDAAEAAKDQRVPTWIGAFLSILSTCIVVCSLCLAKKANNIAKANIAKQLRPLLHFGDVYFSKDRRIFWAEIENRGAGPAINVEVHTISLTEAQNNDACAVSFGTIGAGAKRLHAFDFGEPVFFADNGLDVAALYLSYSSLHYKERFILRGQIYSYDHRLQSNPDRAALHLKRGCPDETLE
ncbi:hypothetical protein [Sphingobium fluviale]|uniref:Uncharacterized protein n=1 Tax=Sphingobium fluviale TaxID=2506423 RepID=A0A4Q1KHH5_9SPHN|nr:hypothetical protein [Sphingobium fluviale]RXR28579.1 hypothetical protein EQG66_09325 [Sphingobium fluviale]